MRLAYISCIYSLHIFLDLHIFAYISISDGRVFNGWNTAAEKKKVEKYFSFAHNEDKGENSQMWCYLPSPDNSKMVRL